MYADISTRIGQVAKKSLHSRVPSDLSSLESTTDGYSVVLGMVDGNLTVLTIADPKKPQMSEYLKALPSRNSSVPHH